MCVCERERNREKEWKRKKDKTLNIDFKVSLLLQNIQITLIKNEINTKPGEINKTYT